MQIKIENNKIVFYDSYKYLEIIKLIPGRKWQPKSKTWEVPYNVDSVVITNQYLHVNLPFPQYLKTEHVTPANDVQIKHLYEHQRISVEVGRQVKYFADLSEPGSGKTLVQIELMLERNQWPVLIVCPKSIMEAVWVKQIQEIMPERIIAVLSNGSDKVKKFLRDESDIIEIGIINYEMVPLVIKELLQIDWKFIILDESTKIKNPSAKRSNAIMKLRDKTLYRSIMTGTLAPNGLLDAFNQFRFLQPKLFGESWYAFRQTYFIQHPKVDFLWFPRPDTMEIFKMRIKPLSVQHHKRDCIDLPPLVEEIRSVELTSQQISAYRQMKEEFILWLDSQEVIRAPFVITQMMKLRQICSGFVYTPEEEVIEISSNKYHELIDVINEIKDRVIIFAHFNATLEKLYHKLKKDKYNVVLFRDASGSSKREALEQFEYGKADIFLANPASAGHGLNLQFCSNIIYYELDFNLENYLQSLQRIERIGQQNKMTLYYLIAEKTIEQFVYKKLKSKEDLNKQLDINELKAGL